MNDDLDLSAVASDAALLDALAAGTAADDDALAGLAALRSALDDDLEHLLVVAAPAPRLQAAPVGDVVALRRPTARRSSQRAAALLAGAALALASTGVAAATYEARPGNAFYGLRTAVAGPRAEDPGVLRDRLDAVQQRLQSPDPATRETARDELTEVAALLDDLDPGLRGDLSRRHAALTEQLAASGRPPGAAGEGPAGPKGPLGPPAGTPGASRTPDSRPSATGRPTSPRPGTTTPVPPARPEPGRPEKSPEERPTQAPTEQPGRPSSRSSQGMDRPDGSRSEEPRGSRPASPAPVTDEEPVEPR